MRGFSIAQFDYIRTLVEHDVAHNANRLAYFGYPPTDDKYKQAVACSKIGLSILEILQTENARMLVELQRHYENQSIEDEIEDPEPHGSRDTFVPHPYEGAVCSQCDSRLNVNDDGRCTACGSQHDL